MGLWREILEGGVLEGEGGVGEQNVGTYRDVLWRSR